MGLGHDGRCVRFARTLRLGLTTKYDYVTFGGSDCSLKIQRTTKKRSKVSDNCSIVSINLS
jgi:hypothetical protein